MNKKPLVSIGMPVYNAESFVGQAIDSLLAQDYENIELIISDNASTDRTTEICQSYLVRDNRIRYFRNEVNLGAARNFNRLFELSKGQYFMWAADHDIWQPEFISTCVSVLEENPEVVLAYSQSTWIDIEGNQLGFASDFIDTRGMSVILRYTHLILRLQWCDMTYGLIRRKVLAKTGKFRDIWGADHAMLAELALVGTFAQIPAPLFSLRQNRPVESVAEKKRRTFDYVNPMTAAHKSRRSTTELWSELRDTHLEIVGASYLPLQLKLAATIITVLCFRIRFGVSIQLLDLSIFLVKLLGRWIR